MSAAGRVLLLNPPGKRLYLRDLHCSLTSKAGYHWPPADLLLAGARLRGRCELAALDAQAEGLGREKALDRAAGFRPGAVLSLIGTASWEEDVSFLRELKDRTGCRLLLSGDVCMDPSAAALDGLPWADGLLVDLAAEGLADFLLSGASVPGVRDRGGRAGPRDGAPKEFRIPPPPHELFPLTRYRLPHARRHPFSSVLRSCGCPYACEFCIQGREVKAFRRRPADNVLEELRRLRALGVREVFFRDQLFEADRADALELCRRMSSEGLGLAWSCNSRVDTLDDELLAAMAAAGCHLVAFGFETADEAVLRRLGKPPAGDALRAIRRCHARGLRVAGYWILGLPGEDRDSVLATIRFAVECGADFASFSVPSPDHGTALRARAAAEGRLPPGRPGFDRSRPSFSLNGKLGEGELAELHALAVRRFYLRPRRWLGLAAGVRNLRQAGVLLGSGLALAKGAWESRGAAAPGGRG